MKRNLIVCVLALLAVLMATGAAGEQTNLSNEIARLVASDGQPFDGFGYNVAIDGDHAVVGAFHKDFSKGAAYVFVRDEAGEWLQEAILQPADLASGDDFGTAVAIDDGVVVVGAPETGLGLEGHVYVFVRIGGDWVQQAKLGAADAAAGDKFGSAVAIEGGTIVVGAGDRDDRGLQSGAAYVFERDRTGDWLQRAELTAPDGSEGDLFGTSVSTSGSAIAVGAPWDTTVSEAAGSAYVFERRPNGNWAYVTKLTAGDAGVEGFDFFGSAIANAANSVLVGAAGGGPGDTGAVYVFARSGRGAWRQQAQLLASDGESGDYFGSSIGLDGSLAAVGSIGDSSAHLFVQRSGQWTEQSKLVVSDAFSGSGSGYSVAISGSTVLSGAWGDGDAGAAYMFEPLG